MDDSVLKSVKKMLGIHEDYDVFDKDIIMHINSVFFTLYQLGVGPDEGFSIDDSVDIWNDFIPQSALLNAVKPYVGLKVRLLFDPPTTSSVLDSINRMINEYEWRINIEVENAKREEEIQDAK